MRELIRRAHPRSRLAAVAGLLVALAGCADKASDASASATTYSISGTVRGPVVAGVTVQVQGSNLLKATTDSLGQYRISRISNGTVTIEASLTGYTFNPPTLTVVVNGASVTGQDFLSVAPPPPPPPPPPPGPEIAGKVTGDGPDGVTMTLMGPEPATSTQTVVTDTDGNYRFPNVATGIYLVTPSRAGGWTFHPADALVTMVATTLNGPDFASIAPTHALSGKVTGAITSGVLVTLSGDAGAVLLTDGAGSYAFTDLRPGNYVVTPSYPGYAFTPPDASVTVGTFDLTGMDFVAAATHRISGRISGDVLEGVTVSLAGSIFSFTTTSTDASGYFEFTDLVDGTYLVKPSLDGYTFGPTELSIPLAGADANGASFTATVSPLATVSGSVSGAVQRGVTVTLQGDPTVATTTDAAGAFRFDAVPAGNYLVIPSHDDYTFDPASRFIVVGTANVTGQAFTATVNPTTRTISGTVGGAANAGVTVTLVGPSPAATSRTTTTDAAGNFAFRGLVDGQYLATPSLPGYAFSPADCLVQVAGPSVTAIQFASAVAPHSISGTVTGPAVAGVTVNLEGAATATTVTAADGSYSFPGLANGDYTVTPSLPGYYFSPVAAPVTLAGANAAGVDFVSALAHSISGFVTGVAPLLVQVKLTGAAVAETTTDASGFFLFPDLPDGGYVLEASLGGYAFLPRFASVVLAGADGTANFTAAPTYTVTGTISGAVLGGVKVELSGAAIQSTTTDGAGGYSFSGVPDGSYMVIPSLAGFGFTPASRAFRIDFADVTGQDFTSVVAP